MEQLFLRTFFSATCTLRGKAMMYNRPLMTHFYVMWAKLVFFKVVLCKFLLMEPLFLKKFFSGTCTLRGKTMMYNQPLMTDFYVMWAKLVFFKVVLCKFSQMDQIFHFKIFFSRTCTLRGKNVVQLTFENSYICYVIEIDVF